MATTVRINEDVKQQLKIKSAELGVKQIDLLNRYVIEGIKRDSESNSHVMSIDEIESLLLNDKPEGNNLKGFVDLVDSNEIVDEVMEKKESYKGFNK